MMYPVRAVVVGSIGMTSCAVVDDVVVSPVAVRIVVGGAKGFRFWSGAVPVK
jgi:hypothetical protein